MLGVSPGDTLDMRALSTHRNLEGAPQGARAGLRQGKRGYLTFVNGLRMIG